MTHHQSAVLIQPGASGFLSAASPALAGHRARLIFMGPLDGALWPDAQRRAMAARSAREATTGPRSRCRRRRTPRKPRWPVLDPFHGKLPRATSGAFAALGTRSQPSQQGRRCDKCRTKTAIGGRTLTRPSNTRSSGCRCSPARPVGRSTSRPCSGSRTAAWECSRLDPALGTSESFASFLAADRPARPAGAALGGRRPKIALDACVSSLLHVNHQESAWKPPLSPSPRPTASSTGCRCFRRWPCSASTMPCSAGSSASPPRW